MKLLEAIQLLTVLYITVVEGRHGSGKSHHHHVHHYRHGATTARCTKCLPGHFAFKQCQEDQDTSCQACPKGTYSPHHTYRHSCFLCSRCGEGLYVARPCVATRDTMCDSCLTYRGPHNRDYRVKCLGLPEVTPSPKKKVLSKKHKLLNSLSDAVEDLPDTAQMLVAHSPTSNHSISSPRKESQAKKTSARQVVSTLTISAICSCLLFLIVLAISVSFRWCCWKRKVTSDGRKYTAVETMEIVAL